MVQWNISYHKSSPIWPLWAYCPANPYFAQYKFVFISILKVVRSFSEGCVLNQIYQHINQHMINLCGTFIFASSFLVLLKIATFENICLFFFRRKTLLSPTCNFDFCNFSKLIKLFWACLYTKKFYKHYILIITKWPYATLCCFDRTYWNLTLTGTRYKRYFRKRNSLPAGH